MDRSPDRVLFFFFFFEGWLRQCFVALLTPGIAWKSGQTTRHL